MKLINIISMGIGLMVGGYRWQRFLIDPSTMEKSYIGFDIINGKLCYELSYPPVSNRYSAGSVSLSIAKDGRYQEIDEEVYDKGVSFDSEMEPEYSIDKCIDYDLVCDDRVDVMGKIVSWDYRRNPSELIHVTQTFFTTKQILLDIDAMEEMLDSQGEKLVYLNRGTSGYYFAGVYINSTMYSSIAYPVVADLGTYRRGPRDLLSMYSKPSLLGLARINYLLNKYPLYSYLNKKRITPSEISVTVWYLYNGVYSTIPDWYKPNSWNDDLAKELYYLCEDKNWYIPGENENSLIVISDPFDPDLWFLVFIERPYLYPKKETCVLKY
jgi:hypothetical protein